MDLEVSTVDKRYDFLVNTVDDDEQTEALCQVSRGLELLPGAVSRFYTMTTHV
jgi:hypothetical protein